MTELLDSNSYDLMNGVYYQKTAQKHTDFENQYIALRKKEGRLLPDDVVKGLPEFHGDNLLKDEWAIRKESTRRLLDYLRQKKTKTILDVGCGNGWLVHYLAKHLSAEVYGLDVNETELMQAARLFGKHERIFLVYGDIFSLEFPVQSFDAIILAASNQYFQNSKELIKRLHALTALSGEIHILDSPLYQEDELSPARQRSEEYFNKIDHPDMISRYFHHSWKVLEAFDFRLQYNPGLWRNRLLIKMGLASPFPWIIIYKQPNI
jgi:SAM-dependent methyltransferase